MQAAESQADFQLGLSLQPVPGTNLQGPPLLPEHGKDRQDVGLHYPVASSERV